MLADYNGKLLFDFIPTGNATIIPDIINLINNIFPSLNTKINDFVSGKSKKILTKLLKEIFIGYVKWKTIELSFKWIRTILQQKRKS